MVQLSHPYMTTRKTTALTRQTFAGKGISLLCNMLSRFVIAFFPRNKCIFMAAVTICNDFGAPQNKVCHCFHSIPIYLPWSDGTKCHDFVFWMLSSKPAFSLSSLTFIKKLFRKKKKRSSLDPFHFLPSPADLQLLILLPAILIPVCASSSPALCMIYSAYKLN